MCAVLFLFEQKACCQVDEPKPLCVDVYVCVSHQHYQPQHQSALIQAPSPPLVFYSSIVSPGVHVGLFL